MKRKRKPFDRSLSLQIDQLQAAIDAAQRAGYGQRVAGLKARLKLLERKIPR